MPARSYACAELGRRNDRAAQRFSIHQMELAMTDLDRATARALVEAGYMPLQEYIEHFELDVLRDAAQRTQTAPRPRAVKVRARFEPQRPASYRVRYQRMRA
jgi:hypothetical protein